MNLKVFLIPAISLSLFVCSCSTPKNVTYFQNLKNGQIVQAEQILDIRVKPEDKLSIMVNAQDPAISTLFNLVQAQNRLQSTTSTTNQVGESGSSNGQLSYYTVDPQGNIKFPVLGELHIAGMTRTEIAEYICSRLIEEHLAKDPIVTVEFGNTGITVLGEVASPGRYEFNKDHLTIIDALGIAGDLTINGRRDNIMVLRADGTGKHQAHFVNLTDAQNVYSSPVFFLQQEDVIYVAPNDKKIRETTPNGNSPYTPSFWISMGSVGLTIATLVITLTR